MSRYEGFTEPMEVQIAILKELQKIRELLERKEPEHEPIHIIENPPTRQRSNGGRKRNPK